MDYPNSLLPGLDYVVAQSVIFAVFTVAFVVLGFYANRAHKPQVAQAALWLAAAVAIGGILYQNWIAGFTPAQFWEATAAFWRAGAPFGMAFAVIAYIPHLILFALLVGWVIDQVVEHRRQRHTA